jgi:UDP-glucose 4-epimerase
MDSLSDFRPFSLLLTGTPGWLCNTVLGLLGETLPALTRVRCLMQPGISDEKLAAWRRAHPCVTEVSFGDLLDRDSLAAACTDLRGGVVLHAAALRHPVKPADWVAVNRDGTLALAQFARDAGVRRFVYISSIAAQGESAINVALTEDMPCYPFSAYGRSKFEAEQGLLKLHEPGAFEVVIIRPSQFYGLPVPPHYVQIFKDVRRGQGRVVAGGKITCSLSHVDDLARGTITALTHPRAAGEVFNLCDAHSYTQLEIFQTIAACVGAKPRFASVSALRCRGAYALDRLMQRYERYRKDLHFMGEAHRHSGASCRKAQQLLGFAPQWRMTEGIKQMVDWAVDQNLMN